MQSAADTVRSEFHGGACWHSICTVLLKKSRKIKFNVAALWRKWQANKQKNAANNLWLDDCNGWFVLWYMCRDSGCGHFTINFIPKHWLTSILNTVAAKHFGMLTWCIWKPFVCTAFFRLVQGWAVISSPLIRNHSMSCIPLLYTKFVRHEEFSEGKAPAVPSVVHFPNIKSETKTLLLFWNNHYGGSKSHLCTSHENWNMGEIHCSGEGRNRHAGLSCTFLMLVMFWYRGCEICGLMFSPLRSKDFT